MGNSPSGARLLGNRNYSSYDIKLDKAATISVTKFESPSGPCWKLVYDVDGMTSTLSITKIRDRVLRIDIRDCYSVKLKEDSGSVCLRELISISVEKEKETGLLYGRNLVGNNFSNFRESLSGEVETQSWTNACGTRKGLLVTQKMKKGNDERPYMVTLAHYYVNSASAGNFGESGVNMGFSVVVKIGAVNGQLDFIVDGPVEHPSSALLYMIEEVVRTGKWKPSACPHCKNLQSQQRRFLLSESEDSDTNLPTPPSSHGGQQNASNMGRFNGDGIGSIIRAYKVNFNKCWS